MSAPWATLLVGLLAVGAPVGDRARFLTMAREMKFFSAQDIIYDHRRPGAIMPPEWVARTEAVRAVVAAPGLDEKALLALLRDRDPKVRTLALAALFRRNDPRLLPHLAALMHDKEKTAPAPALIHVIGLTRPVPPPPLEDQTVGEVATRFVESWLTHSGYRPQEFDAYWAARKDRTFCAGWFLARLDHIVQDTQPLDRERADRVRALRREIDRRPAVDADWTLLWVTAATDSPSPQGAGLLARPKERLRAGQRLGAERLMSWLRGEKVSDDPDLAADKRGQAGRKSLSLWVLRQGGSLLRPADVEAVLALEKDFRTPWCAIAAAELQPDKARDTLHDAVTRFAGRGIHRAWARAELAAALWRLAGEKEIDYLADWFYTEKVDLNPSTSQTQMFLEGIASVRAPVNRKLVARLIADPRFEKLDYLSLGGLVRTVDRWVKEPLLPQEELYSTRYWRGENVAGLDAWRRKLKESVPAWDK